MDDQDIAQFLLREVWAELPIDVTDQAYVLLGFRALVVDTALRRLYPVSCALQVGNSARLPRRALACALTQQRPRPKRLGGIREIEGVPPGGSPSAA